MGRPFEALIDCKRNPNSDHGDEQAEQWENPNGVLDVVPKAVANEPGHFAIVPI
jgi:hypothetical protein